MPLDPVLKTELVDFLKSSKCFSAQGEESSKLLVSQYFDKNPQSLISRENFNILKDDLRFSIVNITAISRNQAHLLSTIEAIIANRDGLRELMELGFAPSNIASILRASCSHSAEAIRQLILPANLNIIKILIAAPDGEEFMHEGELIKGFGFSPQNIAAIFAGGKENISMMMTQLFSKVNRDRIRQLLTPANQVACNVGGVEFMGLAFRPQDISNLIAGSRNNLERVMGQLFAPDVWYKIRKLFTPLGQEAFRDARGLVVYGLGFEVAEFSGVISCGGALNIKSSIDNIFTIRNYSPIYEEDAELLKLVARKIGINENPAPILDLLLINFPNAEVQKDVLLSLNKRPEVGEKKLSRFELPDLKSIFTKIKAGLGYAGVVKSLDDAAPIFMQSPAGGLMVASGIIAFDSVGVKSKRKAAEDGFQNPPFQHRAAATGGSLRGAAEIAASQVSSFSFQPQVRQGLPVFQPRVEENPLWSAAEIAARQVPAPNFSFQPTTNAAVVYDRDGRKK